MVRVKKSAFVMIMAALVLLFAATPALAAEDVPLASWQVRAIPTPVAGLLPSFVSADDDLIAWTGATTATSSTYVFDLATGQNSSIPYPLPGSYFNPSSSGSRVAFQGGRPSTYNDVFVYDFSTKDFTQVTFNSDPGDQHDWDPRLDGELLVWEKNMVGESAQPGIYLYDLETGLTTLLLAGDDYRDPDLWGDYLVCVRNVDGGSSTGFPSEILLFDLSDMESPTSIADTTKNNEHPRISEGRVVWSSADPWVSGQPDPWRSSQIHVYDIVAESDVALTDSVAGNILPAIRGELVAWETKVPSSIMAYDFASASYIKIPMPSDSAHAPDITPYGLVWYGSKGLYTAVWPEYATRFPDVPIMHVYLEGIEGMAEAGIIEGFTSGYFGPEKLVTRQQFAKMIVLATGLVATLEDEWPFTDKDDIWQVPGELYAYHYVARAAESGLIKGYADGSFRPSYNTSRQQVITMVVRAGGLVLQNPPAGWRGVLDYSQEAHGENIRVAEYNGLLDGIAGPEGGLAGWDTTQYATRGECAQLLWNLRQKLDT